MGGWIRLHRLPLSLFLGGNFNLHVHMFHHQMSSRKSPYHSMMLVNRDSQKKSLSQDCRIIKGQIFDTLGTKFETST